MLCPALPAGNSPLLERLLSLALSHRTPLATASAAASVSSCFAATPDGSRTLVHTSSLPARALHHLQDCLASKDWRRALLTLQVRQSSPD